MDTGSSSDHAPSDAAMRLIAIAPEPVPLRKQARPKPTKQNPAGWPWLTRVELDEALKLNSAELVEEIHALSLRLLQGEDVRESRIDAKAQGLLVTAGLSLTAASTFGGVLLQHPEYLQSVGTYGAQIVIAAYAFGLVAGLVAGLLAVLALFVKNSFRNVDEREALDREALNIADAQGKLTTTQSEAATTQSGAAARTAYRALHDGSLLAGMAAELWSARE